MENNVNKRIDGLQSEMEQKLDNLQYSISKLANHLVHQEEEYLEGEWLTDQEDLLQEPVEAPEELPTGEAGGGRGKEAGEEPQEPILQPIPMDLDPNATAQPQNSTLPVYILPTPVAKATHAAPAPNHKSNPSLHVMQKFKKLVANVQAFATTSKTQAIAYIAWRSGWFGCRFGFGAPKSWHF